MASFYIRNNSPFYWISFYDKFDTDPRSRRKKISSKVEITKSDRERYENWKKAGASKDDIPDYQGNKKIREVLNEIIDALRDKELYIKSGLKIKKRKLLSEALKEFVKIRTVPGHDKHIKYKTKLTYENAVNHFINANGNKFVDNYTYKEDYINFLQYLEDIEAADHSRAIHSRHLHSIWNYFIEEGYTDENIIRKINAVTIPAEPIDLDDLKLILRFYKNRDIKQYHVIYYLLLSACRPSSALVQTKQNINLKSKFILIENVKARKFDNKYYYFPIHKALEKVINEILKYSDPKADRLFSHYKLTPKKYTEPLRWWYRDMVFLNTAEEGKKPAIKYKYKLQQLRETFASYAVNELRIDPFIVQKLLDHSDIKVTDSHYIKRDLSKIRSQLDGFDLEL